MSWAGGMVHWKLCREGLCCHARAAALSHTGGTGAGMGMCLCLSDLLLLLSGLREGKSKTFPASFVHL